MASAHKKRNAGYLEDWLQLACRNTILRLPGGFMRPSYGFALSLYVLLGSSIVHAEGSAELDAADGAGNYRHDQALTAATELFVDIVDGTTEEVCWNGTGNLTLSQPDGTAIGGAVADGTCRNAVNGVSGAYRIALAQNQTRGNSMNANSTFGEWDIRVCPKGTTYADCFDPMMNNERLGRLWSYTWRVSNPNLYSDAYSINGSVYAIVPGGQAGHDAVIEMQMRGVCGADYSISANTVGPESSMAPITRIGRSVAKANAQVRPSLPIYLNPPAVALYNWISPMITNVVLAPSCGTGIVQDGSPGSISFTSNVTGQYVVICDVNKDTVFDFASQTDFSSFGTAIAGTNMVSWDGKTNAGTNATPGDYSCLVRLNVGEFHYDADDIETSYPGIRMFRIENDKTTRTPIEMFWDDSGIGNDAETMNNMAGQFSPDAPPAAGLNPGAYANAPAPFYYIGGSSMGEMTSMPTGNARAWGNFDGDGKGNNNFLDQFAAAETAISAPFMVSVFSSTADADNDGLTSARECMLGANPNNPDSDGDGVNDGDEATMVAAPNTDNDGPIDILDPDSDNDGVGDGEDGARLDPNECRDMDGDQCDDCAITGADESGGATGGDGVDTDGDGQCNTGDADDDGDDVPDPMDVKPLDPDADKDGVSDGEDDAPEDPMRCRDADQDTCDDCSVTGADGSGGDPNNDGEDGNGDGRCDAADDDSDGDGVSDADDLDRDNDGIPNTDEGDGDADGDGTPNALDLDSDGDGLSDISEAGGSQLDADGDGRIDSLEDANPRDGLHDPLQAADSALPRPDTDLDGAPDFLDADDDDDGIATPDELNSDGSFRDSDGDGRPDHLDADDGGMNAGDSDGDGVSDAEDLDRDNDGIPNAEEGDGDADGDGTPNALDLDSDGDGLSDIFEAGGGQLDEDGDGRIDSLEDANPRDGLHDPLQASDGALPRPDSDLDGTPDFLDVDDDDDGIPTDQERPDGESVDTDGDTQPDYLDPDDDDDGIATADELNSDRSFRDSDDDGRPDHLDADDDGDGVSTRDERTTSGRDRDTDGDGKPDHLDVDDDGDGVPTMQERRDADRNGTPDRLERPRKGTLAGGALCSVRSAGSSTEGALSIWLAVGVMVVAATRGKRRRRLRRRAATRLWLILVASAAALNPGSRAQAQVAVDQFHLAPLWTDGFGVSRPSVLPHATVGAILALEYANDPLVYERTPRDPDSEEHVISDDFVLHFSIAVGLWDRVTFFAGAPVHLAMDGEDRLTIPAALADGGGLGDVFLGGRVLIAGDDESTAALAGEFIARLPTADWADEDQNYRGDAIGSYEPALVFELRAGAFDVRFRGGARLRKDVSVSNLDLGHELAYGVGARLHVAKPFWLHAEAYGSTFLNEPFAREHSPAEALFGAKLDIDGWGIGAAAGPGLLRGYGSPDYRVIGMLGYAEPRRTVPPRVDTDRDGLYDDVDKCPREPEDRDGFKDEDGCPDPDNDGDGILDVSDGCRNKPEDADQFEDADGCPDPDNDADGILDADDRCPLQPEDSDGFEDEDGCPDPDNDKDGVLDVDDRCPIEPEDFDGWEDSDGCPEEASGLVKLTCEKIEIKDSVYFDSGSDHIQERSFTLLNQVAGVLQAATQIKRLRVEGHTDDRGKDAYNLELSQRRAAAVMKYLVERGVADTRLTSEGYGETRPIADNKTAAGRSQNRRVEFVVLESEGCP
jgi:outer membrane protein OmpA-like peptidoglycan-associated protein